jgi:hypothetical protein
MEKGKKGIDNFAAPQFDRQLCYFISNLAEYVWLLRNRGGRRSI